MGNTINVEDKVVFLTGAFGLVGKQISSAFIKDGAKVVLAGHNSTRTAIEETKLKKHYSADNYYVCNLELTDSGSIVYAVNSAIERFGRIDVLVNNAAIDAKFEGENISDFSKTSFENFPIDSLQRTVSVNMIGTIELTQVVCKQMLKQGGGNIINVGSIYSIIAPNQRLYDFGENEKSFKPVDYIVSKSYLPNFTRYLASFYAKKNIRCNCIAPHGIYNNHDEEFIRNFAELSPAGRMCNKEELDGAFLFLASDSSSYINGITLLLDGGWTSI